MYRLPPRWLDCPRKGDLIADTFLPMKTPLDERYASFVPEHKKWDIKLLFDFLRLKEVNMGLIIDLTFTDRFYDKSLLEKYDCTHVKLQCRGHDETPTEEQTEAFAEICTQYLKINPTKIIGVHCTHGFNRTGFLIISYLVERRDYSLDDALEIFRNARAPGIYKQDYIDVLYKQLGDSDDTPRAPVLPDWYFQTEENNKVEPVMDVTKNSLQPIKRLQKMPEFAIETTPPLKPVIELSKLYHLQKKCQSLCQFKQRGFPGCQPVSLDHQSMRYFKMKPYKVSWKADGTRYLLLIDGVNEIYFFDRDNNCFHAPFFVFPDYHDETKHLDNTLVDGELVEDRVGSERIVNFLIYDIIRFKGQDVCNARFSIRLLCIGKEIIEPRKRLPSHVFQKEPFQIRRKDFWDISLAHKILTGKKFENLSHEVDGLIFQPSVDPYFPGQCPTVLKWKPSTHNSVDFRLKIVQIDGLGLCKEKKGYLYVSGLDVQFAEITLTKELRSLDGKIIECTFDLKTSTWKFMRERTDKSFPNAYHTARAVCRSIMNPITKEVLLSYIEKERWRDPRMKSGTTVNNSSVSSSPKTFITKTVEKEKKNTVETETKSSNIVKTEIKSETDTRKRALSSSSSNGLNSIDDKGSGDNKLMPPPKMIKR